MKAALNLQGPDAQTNTSEQFAEFIQGEIEDIARLIGLKAE